MVQVELTRTWVANGQVYIGPAKVEIENEDDAKLLKEREDDLKSADTPPVGAIPRADDTGKLGTRPDLSMGVTGLEEGGVEGIDTATGSSRLDRRTEDASRANEKPEKGSGGPTAARQGSSGSEDGSNRPNVVPGREGVDQRRRDR